MDGITTSRQTTPAACCQECGCASHADAVDLDALKGIGLVLAALADPIRLGIVQLLSRHDAMCVCDLVEAFPVGQPTISHHLKCLRAAELVNVERRGHWAYYRLRRETLKQATRDLIAAL
jgi:ArsR family transcriptional regulator